MELKEAILKGLNTRKESLEKQMCLAHDADLKYIEEDSAARLDEVESLINWIEDL